MHPYTRHHQCQLGVKQQDLVLYKVGTLHFYILQSKSEVQIEKFIYTVAQGSRGSGRQLKTAVQSTEDFISVPKSFSSVFEMWLPWQCP